MGTCWEVCEYDLVVPGQSVDLDCFFCCKRCLAGIIATNERGAVDCERIDAGSSLILCQKTVEGHGNRRRRDRPRRRFERPVAAERRAAGRIGRRGDVGASQRRDVGEKQSPGVARGDIASIEEDVGIGRERAGPPADLAGMEGKGAHIEPGAAELQPAGEAVRIEMDGGNVALAAERLCDLRELIPAGIEHHRMEAGRGRERGDDRRLIPKRPVDKGKCLRGAAVAGREHRSRFKHGHLRRKPEGMMRLSPPRPLGAREHHAATLPLHLPRRRRGFRPAMPATAETAANGGKGRPGPERPEEPGDKAPRSKATDEC